MRTFLTDLRAVKRTELATFGLGIAFYAAVACAVLTHPVEREAFFGQLKAAAAQVPSAAGQLVDAVDDATVVPAIAYVKRLSAKADAYNDRYQKAQILAGIERLSAQVDQTDASVRNLLAEQPAPAQASQLTDVISQRLAEHARSSN